jgi:hypothetical protein
VLWSCGDSSAPLANIPTWEEYLSASTIYFEDKTIYVIEGDLAVSLEELREHYQRGVEAAEQQRTEVEEKIGTSHLPSIVNLVGSSRDVWSASTARNLTYCVSNDFGSSKTRVVDEMAQASAGWEAVANVDFQYLSAHDGNCFNTNGNVLFAVRPWNGNGACAFFPSGGGCEIRTVVMNLSSFSQPVTTLGVFRHELGHVLGLRHEHIRVAGTTPFCTESSNWSSLTNYDSASVMHYPWCPGSTNGGDLVITSQDAAGAAMLYPPPAPPPTNELNPIATAAINGGDQWMTGDFNADGAADVYFWWRNTGNNRLFMNNGSGGLTEITNPIPTTGINGGDQWITGDFNGDGATDVYFWWKSNGNNRLFMNNGSGGFTQYVNPIPTAGINGGDQWIVGDFNGDGDDDVYFWWKSAGTNRLYLSNSSGGFTSFMNPIGTVAINGGDEWRVGDFNGDGRTDVYFWWKSAGTNRLYLSGANGTFTQYLDPIGAGGINGGDQWTSGDFNGDGRTDVYFWWKNAGTNRLYLSGTNGTFTQHLNPIGTGSINGGDQWTIGDFNGDGLADAYFWWKSSGQNRLYRNNGNQTFTEETDPIPRARISSGDQWTVGDFNRNGIDDVYFWWKNAGTNRLFLGL